MSGFEHDAPSRGQDYELLARAGDRYDFAVYVSAVGGGTVGRRYERNHWHYVVVDYRSDSPRWGQVIAQGSDLFIPAAVTHREVADIAVEFVTGDDC